MATPSLQDVLAAVPAVAELVDQMTELLPGCPANEPNLQTLWKHMQHVVCRESPYPDGCRVPLDLVHMKKKVYQELHVKVLGPCVPARRDGQIYTFLRPCISGETHKNTGEGLLQGFLCARQVLQRYRAEGACPGCCSTDLAPTPVRRLKAAGMPRCADCMITGIMSQPPSKRARSSRE
jgi:hypothetical protein